MFSRVCVHVFLKFNPKHKKKITSMQIYSAIK